MPFAGWLVGAAWFFRAPLLSGFARVQGDPGDTRLLALLREHWWKVLRGATPWRDLGFFHPWPNVLGFSDTFMLESVVYVPWRVLGAEPLLASQLTVISLSAIGFAGWWVVLGRLGLEGRRWVRLGLTALATFPHQLAQQVLHQQLLSVWWLPWTIVFGLAACRATRQRSRVVAATGAGLVWGLVLSSTVYVGWFVVFVGALLGVTLIVGELVAGRARRLVGVARRHADVAVAMVAGGLVGLVPFALVYLPTRAQTGERPYWAVAHFGPRPFDIVNAGRGNALWGALLRAVAPGDPARLGNIEVAMAVPPVLLVVAGVLWRRMPRRGGASDASATRGRRRVVGAMLLVAAICVVLPVEWGPVSTWRAVYSMVPGAGALRVAGRLWIVVHALVVVAIALAVPVTDGRDRHPARWRRWAVVVVVGLVAAEQVDLVDRASLDRGDDIALLESAAGPPAWCEVMAVRGGDTSVSFISPSIDAMRIADSLGLHTVNGYSGMFPTGYPIRHDRPRHARQFATYVRELGLEEPVCVFDLDARRWLEDPLDRG